MSPSDLLTAATSAGLALRVESGALRVRGSPSALATWAPRLKAHKPELIALLQPPSRQSKPAPVPAKEPATPICEVWEERCAILEHDAGLSRAEAQATCRRWLIQEPDGWRDCTHTPPASRAEIQAWHPDALAIIPADDDADPWGGEEDPEGNEPGHPQEEDPGAAFYRDLFAGMEGPRAHVTLSQAETHRAVVAGLIRPEEARGAVLLATKSPQGYALLAIPQGQWDPFKALALLDEPGTVH
jgi:hypothetical protein